jgi:hypothetical protein
MKLAEIFENISGVAQFVRRWPAGGKLLQRFVDAAALRDKKAVQTLLQDEVTADLYGTGTWAMMIAAGHGDIELVKFYLDCGVNGHGAALCSAAQYGHLMVVEMLLDRGADPRSTESWGGPALIFAAGAGQLEVAKLLIHRGADPAQTDSTGKTAIDHARKRSHTDMVEYLSNLDAAS